MPASPLTAAEAFGPHVLALDCAAETARIGEFMTRTVARRLNRRGVVLGVSGGIDSAVCAALSARILGPDRVFALLMPEQDSSDDSAGRAARLCEALGIPYVVENITASLEAAGCYRRRDEAIRTLFPAYGAGWRHKIVLSDSVFERERIPYFNLVVETPDGERMTARMPLEVYLQVVAATNFKQRIRKNMDYYHADRLNYAVIGTPNRLEYDLGFFVRGGDGLADLKPIAHLYKSQVYAMAAHLGVTEEIRRQMPSTDTYSLPQGQDEFYFSLPYDRADLLLFAMRNKISMEAAAPAIGLTVEQAERVARDFAAKQRMAARLSGDAYLVEKDVEAEAAPAAAAE